MSRKTAETDPGLQCLLLLARFHGRPAGPEEVRHALGLPSGPLDAAALLRGARWLGLKARLLQRDWRRLSGTPLPAIGQARDGGFFLIAKVDGHAALIQRPLQDAASRLCRADFEALWCGWVIVARRADAPSLAAGSFGFGWFVPAILKYRHLLGEVLLASFFLQLFALITPLFFQVVIDKVLVHQGLTTLDVLALGLLAIAFFDCLLSGLRTYVFSHTSNRIDVSLGANLFHHLLKLPLAYFEARRVGDTVARVRELETIRNFITGSAVTLVIDLLFTMIFFLVMYLYSPLLSLVVAGAIPLYLLLALMVTPLLRRRLHEKFSRGADSQAFLVESVRGIETLKAAAVEPQMQRAWEDRLAGYVRASFRAGHLSNIANQSANLVNKITLVLILWLGARLVIEGQLSVGQLVAFNLLAMRVSAPILRLGQLWQDFQQAGISVQRLGDILNAAPEPGHGDGRSTLPSMTGRVQLHGVTFRYRPDGREALHAVSLDVAPGEIVGIVGPSGSGKSTLTKLIQRLYAPQNGHVLIDGVDLALVNTPWLRRNIGVVLQENILFNRSVRHNIALADPATDMERVMHAARLAGAHEFILQLPEGYDTEVGEHGCKLSGGQRQRIAIARALMADPCILILDEATSALDYESEAIIHGNMQRICRDRTVFIIAHRLNAVRFAHRIVVLDNGSIAECGSHSELLQRDGQYARLHRHQVGLAVVSV